MFTCALCTWVSLWIEYITCVCMCSLSVRQARPPKNVPPEENIESACEMITVTGKMLSNSESKKTRDAVDGYLARLTRLSESKELASRIKFLVSGTQQHGGPCAA